jgi:hypothetical protein
VAQGADSSKSASRLHSTLLQNPRYVPDALDCAQGHFGVGVVLYDDVEGPDGALTKPKEPVARGPYLGLGQEEI